MSVFSNTLFCVQQDDCKQKNLRETYKTMDKNGDGKVTIDELKMHYERLNDNSYKDMMERWDKDDNKYITEKEFMDSFAKK
uniref:uncharacterized protein n=1 Tax=Myxine glutinosa TaxID=7769 RepID=UPI00358F03B5